MESISLLTGKRLLVVDEDDLLNVDVIDRLRRLDVEIDGPFRTVEAALARLQGGVPIDGAILDMKLRSENAYALADLLMQRKVPFVFALAYKPYERYPGFVFCERPFELDSIARALFGERAGGDH